MLLTVAEAAERLNVSIYTVRRYIAEGRFDEVFRLKSAYRIPETALQTFLERYGNRRTTHD